MSHIHKTLSDTHSEYLRCTHNVQESYTTVAHIKACSSTKPHERQSTVQMWKICTLKSTLDKILLRNNICRENIALVSKDNTELCYKNTQFSLQQSYCIIFKKPTSTIKLQINIIVRLYYYCVNKFAFCLFQLEPITQSIVYCNTIQ